MTLAEAELLEEETESAPVGGDSKAGGVRRRRRTYSRSVPEHFKASKQFGVEADLHRDRLSGAEACMVACGSGHMHTHR